MNGLLVVDKPAGLTSHDVVARVRRWGRFDKVGHTGTLDPFATGVLPLCLERATRLAGLLTLEDKRYRARLKLGERTDTLDCDGQVTGVAEVPDDLRAEQVEAALEAFRGPILQTPPMYSALKVGGQTLHKLARAGQEVAREPRPVTILELRLLGVEMPIVELEVFCTKGTYVRVLASDLGDALGTGGHLVALRRLSTGPFDLAQALSLEEVKARLEAGSLEECLIPPVAMLPGLPSLELDEAQVARVLHGNPLRWREVLGLETHGAGTQVRLLSQGQLVAVGELLASGAAGAPALQPRVVL